MKLTKIKINGLRNLKEIEFTPSSGCNIIYGENAQGKTNLIEGIWLFTGQKSFRSGNESRLLGFDEEFAQIEITFDDHEREQVMRMNLTEKKSEFFLNKVPQKSIRGFLGNFYAVIFTPSHLKIIQEGPSYRRRFLNQGISQLRRDYAGYYLRYQKALLQRNNFLKKGKNQDELLDIWDLQLAKLGTVISLLRSDYVKKIRSYIKEIYSELTSGKEEIDIEYQSTVFDKIEDEKYSQEKVNQYYEQLKKKRQKDLEYKTTSIGVHRDDLEMKINGHSVKHYGSQGQQRSCVIALKLGEAKMIEEITNQEPVVLLDDVMSELDQNRQKYILEQIKSYQVFLTCCNLKEIENQTGGKKMEMKEGRLKD